MKKSRNIVVTLECFVKKDGKYLMLHRAPEKRIMPDVWMAPGGHREFNEGLFACARREVMEETGLRIKHLKIKATGCAYLRDLNQEFYFHFLVADCAGGRLKPKADDGEFVWLTPQQILRQKNLLSELKTMLPYVFQNNQSVVSFRAVYEKGNHLKELEVETP
ncbi:NUDIX hydrolase [Patescibacteria group bacterium]|nr:NUDIX hydrolase [Patescibacteria group bacterium]MCL5091592.1 NUDIX hydrolase [Patescibacteria group bacterium]